MKILKPINIKYSLKENLIDRIIQFLRIYYFNFCNSYIKSKVKFNIQFQREIEQKEFKEQDYIITCYFINLKDPIKGVIRKFPDINYISPWYNSMREHGLNGIIVHDGLGGEFIDKYETDKIKFCEYSPGGYSVFEERWMAYQLILSEHPIKRVFFTDSNDVIVNYNPFTRHTSSSKLFVGRDCANRIGDSQWVLNEMNSFMKDSGYKINRMIIYQRLYNAGIVGGNVGVVRELIERIISLTLMTKTDSHKDMSLLNIAVFELIKPKLINCYFQEKLTNPKKELKSKNLETGFPLNSEFNCFEKNSKATFIHK